MYNTLANKVINHRDNKSIKRLLPYLSQSSDYFYKNLFY